MKKIVISTVSGYHLAKEFAQKQRLEYIESKLTFFENEEQKVTLPKKVSLKSVILFAPITPPVDTLFVRTLLTLSSLEHLLAKDVTLIIPWLGYSLQNKVFLPGESLSSEIIARSINSPLIKEVILVDTHDNKICQKFNSPCRDISVEDALISQINKNVKALPVEDILIVGPDNGSKVQLERVAKKLDLPWLIYLKDRDRFTGQITRNGKANVRGKHLAIIFDDGILSGKTIVTAAENLRKNGIEKVLVYAVHGLLLNDSLDKMQNVVDQVVVTNTIPESVAKANKFLKVVDVTQAIATQL